MNIHFFIFAISLLCFHHPIFAITIAYPDRNFYFQIFLLIQDLYKSAAQSSFPETEQHLYFKKVLISLYVNSV